MIRIIFSILLTMCLFPVRAFRPPAQAERVIISTDREVYIAGDRLWFMLHLTNEESSPYSYLHLSLNNPAGSRIFDGCLKLNKNHTYGSIYLTDTLTSGVYELVSFTNFMRNQGSASYGRKSIIIANRFDDQFSGITGLPEPENVSRPEMRDIAGVPGSVPEIMTDKVIYGKREKVTVSITMPENSHDQILSVAVRLAAPVSLIPRESQNLVAATDHSCHWLPEKSGLILQGNLRDEKGDPAPGMNVFLSSLDTLPNLQYSITNAEGIFRFFLNPYYFGKMLAIKSDGIFNGTIALEDRYESVDSTREPVMAVTGDLIRFLENNQKFLTIAKSYGLEHFNEGDNPHTGTGYCPAVYESDPQVVYPSDYTPLPDFIEISREILPLLKTRLVHGKYESSLLGLDLKAFMPNFIFVDGILIEDVNQIISFNSDQIRKIEVMPFNRYLGDLHIPGVLSIVTENHEIHNLAWTRPVRKIVADSIMQLSTYVPQNREILPGHIPDFRPLIHWEPQPGFTVDHNYRFETQTSDCTGKFEIVVTCCNESGNRSEWRKEFNVMNQ